MAPAGVRRDHGVPRGALSRAAAPGRRSRRPRARAALDLPARRLHEAVLRAAPRRGRRGGALRRRARRSSTLRSPLGRGSAGASTGSPTSPTCRGCCARATCSASPLDGVPCSFRMARAARRAAVRSRWRSRSLPHSELPRVVDAAWLADASRRRRISSSATCAARTRTCAGTSRARVRSCSARRRPAPTRRRSRSSRRRSRCACAGTGSPGASGSCSSIAATASARCRRAQMAELAGHPRVAILLGGIAGVAGRARGGPGRARAGARGVARAEPARVADAAGARGAARRSVARRCSTSAARRSTRASAAAPCDPRQGHIPGARRVEVGELFARRRAAALAGADPRARRRARGSRGRRVLPLRLALRARDARAAQRGLRRAELRRLLARVEPAPRAAARALSCALPRLAGFTVCR